MIRKVSLIKSLDWWSVALYALLVFLGWINIYAAVYNDSHQSILDFSQRYGKQLIWICAAAFLVVLILIIDSKFYSAFAYPIFFSLLLTLILLLVFGRDVKGARSWIDLGFFRFQPAEFTKFATCLALAQYASQYNFKIQQLKSLFTAGLIILSPMLLIVLQGDAGSALVYTVFLLVLYREGLPGIVIFLGFWAIVLFVITLLIPSLWVLGLVLFLGLLIALFMGVYWLKLGKAILILGGTFGGLFFINLAFNFHLSPVVLFIATIVISSIPFLIFTYMQRLKKIAFLILIVMGSIFFSYSVGYVFENILEVHQRTRINEFLGIESNPYGSGYNVAQSKIAIGSGGFLGKGFLNGTQTKFKFVPEQSTDFIFCTVGEEWGFVGAVGVILLELLFVLRLIFLAERQRSTFSRIYGYGVACILFFHLAVNIGMTIGLLPVIGIPLPFFSYGGSSLWSFTILVFIFLRLDANRLELFR